MSQIANTSTYEHDYYQSTIEQVKALIFKFFKLLIAKMLTLKEIQSLPTVRLFPEY